ncbi:MAG: glycosyltransferase family 2 protein [Saprospiraceae bacterium]|nr:glycosyltransferase family 2 protein [Saprospiraceae bacterium]
MTDNNIKIPKVAIVILNYNGMKDNYLETFLPSVYRSEYPNLAIYVADNNSTDNSVEYLKNQGFISLSETIDNLPTTPRFLIELEKNYWFAAGYNRALKNIKADYYILLNSDVEVSSNWINPIINLMEEDHQIAACQPKIRMYKNKKLFEHAGASGGWIDKWGYPFCRGRVFAEVEEDKGQYDSLEEIFWASGAALFIRSDLFHHIGGFDEAYQAHMEEIDLCWRLKRANYKIIFCPESVVWHVGGGTLPKHSPHKAFLNFRNSLATIYKNTDRKKVNQIILIRLLLDAIAGLRFLLQFEFANFWALIRAHRSFFSQYKYYKSKRKEELILIEKYCYQKPYFRNSGVYPKSIVWQHFIKGKNAFDKLDS